MSKASLSIVYWRKLSKQAVAESFTMEPGHVLTSMAVEDDLFEGDSYFVAEIKSIKRLLEQVQQKERCYCFVDEILKGTNTIERIAASASIIHWLSRYPSLAFIATHDIELTEILKNDCSNIHFSEQVTADDGISFDYKVKQVLQQAVMRLPYCECLVIRKINR